MVDNTAAPVPTGDPVTDKASDKVSLNRFCTDLSTTDKRVELIGGFHHSEKVAGRLRDTAEAYSQRYAAFATATPQ
jgi:alpha-beta hydrolase superfamily lysophospholipase